MAVALVFVAYLLSALSTTGAAAELAALDLLTRASPASLRITFITQPGVLPELAGKDLILVTARNGAYYVVEREPSPPGPWATSYAISVASVEGVRVRPFAAGAPYPGGAGPCGARPPTGRPPTGGPASDPTRARRRRFHPFVPANGRRRRLAALRFM